MHLSPSKYLGDAGSHPIIDGVDATHGMVNIWLIKKYNSALHSVESIDTTIIAV
jgi:hypothetical protein